MIEFFLFFFIYFFFSLFFISFTYLLVSYFFIFIINEKIILVLDYKLLLSVKILNRQYWH
jgi:hypothetical protein